MSKVKNFFIDVKNNWNESKSSKLAKILSFVFGLLFGLIGIILVAIWKYIFSNNEEVNKHCIKLAIIGAITKFIICSKIIAMQMFGWSFPINSHNEKPIFHKPHHHFVRTMNDFDSFFTRNFIEIDRAFEEAFENQERMFSNAMKEMENFEKEAQKNTKRTKKVSIDKDGTKKTIIEEQNPRFYKKVVMKERGFEKQDIDEKKADDKTKKREDKKQEKRKNKKEDRRK